MNRLWVRFSIAFAGVVFLGLVAGAFLVQREVNLRFRRFVAESAVFGTGRVDAPERDLLRHLATYYAENGSWDGVSTLLDGRGAGPGRLPPVFLADASGTVVYPEDEPEDLSRSERRLARPIVVGGGIVGYLGVHPVGPGGLTSAGAAFLGQVNRALVRAGLLAGALGLLVGVALARGLAAPLASLGEAARRISRGDLTPRVPEDGAEEIAEVSRAFNEMAAELQQAERVRQSMVADIAHELRTPLSVIQGNLRAILDGVYTLSRDEVEHVYDESRVLGRLVDDLAELANAEAGQLGLRTARIDPVGLARSAAAAHTDRARAAGVSLTVEAPDTLPEILADADRTRQVLGNLLDNAVRHTPVDGVVRLDVAASSPGQVLFRVSDTGPGIRPADQARVFDRFWRADRSRSRAGGGSGLGLAIARRLVEAQGGEMGVTSRAGHGATFWFTVPVAAEMGRPAASGT